MGEQFSHFLDAQKVMYGKAFLELKNGKKENHWMWYIFPQAFHEGMGSVATRFALGRNEREAYLAHPVLGTRLVECTNMVLSHTDKSLLDIFGSDIDARKFLACMRFFKGSNNSILAPSKKVWVNQNRLQYPSI